MATYYKPVLKLKEKTYHDLKVLAQEVKNATDGNPLFPSVPVSALVQQTNIDNFSNLIEEWGVKGNHGSQLCLAKLKEARDVIRRQLRSIAAYINSVALGHQSTVLAAGFPVTSDRTVYGTLPAPANLRSPNSDRIITAEVPLRWNRVRGSKSYVIYGALGVVDDAMGANASQFSIQAVVPDTRAILTTFKDAQGQETRLAPGSRVTYYVRPVCVSENGHAKEGGASVPFFAWVHW